MRGTSAYFSKQVSVFDPLMFEPLLGKVSGSVWVWLPLTLRQSYEWELLYCGFPVDSRTKTGNHMLLSRSRIGWRQRF